MPESNLAVEWVPTDKVFCSPANPRLNDPAVPHVAASIRRFGWQQPIVAKRSGEVIAGNTRLKAAGQLGLTQVPVVWFDGSDLDATAYAIADNRTAEFAEWDQGALGKLLEELRREDSLAGVGYSTAEIDQLLLDLQAQQLDPDAVEDPGPGEPPETPVSRAGDLWILGNHRLLCGDSTKAADVVRVMAGEKAGLVATDPPYLVDYTGERPNDSGKDWTDTYREIDIKDADGFFRAVFTNVLTVLGPKAAIYCWHAHKRCGDIQRIWRELGILDHQQIIWVKPTSVFGRVYWHFRHEPCMMGWRQGSQPDHDSQHEFNSVWEVDWDGKARIVGNEHPCLHPDALVLTARGYRRIATINVGDRVYSADGRFHFVSDVSSHPYGSPSLYRIVVKESNLSTLATDNHPFLVWRPRREGRRILGGRVSWMRADQMRIGDYTMTPVLEPRHGDPYPERDAQFWFLFGVYLAQSSLQRAWQRDAPSQDVAVVAFDAAAGSEFKASSGRGRRISPLVLDLPRDKRLAVLLGWLNGDVCQVHGQSYRQGRTGSQDLAAHLALLGESVGYKANLFRYDPPELPGKTKGGSKHADYHLYFHARDRRTRNARITHVEHDGRSYTIRYVKRVDRVPYVGDVWNLSVDGCPSFQTAVGMSHNTEKPVELFARPMRKHTQFGDVVFEPFSGSGSQLIAAEKLGRRCRALEISPAYVDVAVRRWEVAMGKEALLEGAGKTFRAVADERGAVASSASLGEPAAPST